MPQLSRQAIASALQIFHHERNEAKKQAAAPPRRDAHRLTGTVRWFDVEKRYGYIAADGGSANVFVHISAVESAGIDPTELVSGACVSFELEEGPRGGDCATMLVLIPDDGRRQFYGVVEKWFDDRAFGFIRRDDGEVAFVHRRDTPFEPKLGEKVAFDLITQADSGRGRAIRLRRA